VTSRMQHAVCAHTVDTHAYMHAGCLVDTF
jgi:hypothetical protein